jgi:hypothetical protein
LFYWHRERNVGDRTGVSWRDFCFARDVLHVGGEKRVEFRGYEGGGYYCLAEVFGLVVEVPISDTAKIATMGFFRLEIEVGKYVFDMLPVLH